MNWTDEERAIFSFHDGVKERRVDPLVLRRRLLRASAGRLGELLKASTAPRPTPDGQPVQEQPGVVIERQDAQEQLALIFHEAFEMPPFNPETGEGFTETAVWRVWREWGLWVKKKGTPESSSATPQPSTAST